jgi:hypothetical protein
MCGGKLYTGEKKDELEIIVCNKFINKLVKQYN